MNQLEQYVHQNFQESYEEVSNSQRAHFLPILTLEEKTIIYEYTNWEYLAVNSSLRKSNGTNVSEFAQYLDKILAKLPNYKDSVYRGAELPEPIFDKFQQAFLNKTPIIEHAFLSTSKSQIVAQEYFVGNFLFEIFGKKGKSIENIAKFGTYSYDNEQEVLFRKNSRFKVSDITKRSKYTLITLKEL